MLGFSKATEEDLQGMESVQQGTSSLGNFSEGFGAGVDQFKASLGIASEDTDNLIKDALGTQTAENQLQSRYRRKKAEMDALAADKRISELNPGFSSTAGVMAGAMLPEMAAWAISPVAGATLSGMRTAGDVASDAVIRDRSTSNQGFGGLEAGAADLATGIVASRFLPKGSGAISRTAASALEGATTAAAGEGYYNIATDRDVTENLGLAAATGGALGGGIRGLAEAPTAIKNINLADHKPSLNFLGRLRSSGIDGKISQPVEMELETGARNQAAFDMAADAGEDPTVVSDLAKKSNATNKKTSAIKALSRFDEKSIPLNAAAGNAQVAGGGRLGEFVSDFNLNKAEAARSRQENAQGSIFNALSDKPGEKTGQRTEAKVSEDVRSVVAEMRNEFSKSVDKIEMSVRDILDTNKNFTRAERDSAKALISDLYSIQASSQHIKGKAPVETENPQLVRSATDAIERMSELGILGKIKNKDGSTFNPMDFLDEFHNVHAIADQMAPNWKEGTTTSISTGKSLDAGVGAMDLAMGGVPLLTGIREVMKASARGRHQSDLAEGSKVATAQTERLAGLSQIRQKELERLRMESEVKAKADSGDFEGATDTMATSAEADLSSDLDTGPSVTSDLGTTSDMPTEAPVTDPTSLAGYDGPIVRQDQEIAPEAPVGSDGLAGYEPYRPTVEEVEPDVTVESTETGTTAKADSVPDKPDNKTDNVSGVKDVETKDESTQDLAETRKPVPTKKEVASFKNELPSLQRKSLEESAAKGVGKAKADSKKYENFNMSDEELKDLSEAAVKSMLDRGTPWSEIESGTSVLREMSDLMGLRSAERKGKLKENVNKITEKSVPKARDLKQELFDTSGVEKKFLDKAADEMGIDIDNLNASDLPRLRRQAKQFKRDDEANKYGMQQINDRFSSVKDSEQFSEQLDRAFAKAKVLGEDDLTEAGLRSVIKELSNIVESDARKSASKSDVKDKDKLISKIDSFDNKISNNEKSIKTEQGKLDAVRLQMEQLEVNADSKSELRANPAYQKLVGKETELLSKIQGIEDQNADLHSKISDIHSRLDQDEYITKAIASADNARKMIDNSDNRIDTILSSLNKEHDLGKFSDDDILAAINSSSPFDSIEEQMTKAHATLKGLETRQRKQADKISKAIEEEAVAQAETAKAGDIVGIMEGIRDSIIKAHKEQNHMLGDSLERALSKFKDKAYGKVDPRTKEVQDVLDKWRTKAHDLQKQYPESEYGPEAWQLWLPGDAQKDLNDILGSSEADSGTGLHFKNLRRDLLGSSNRMPHISESQIPKFAEQIKADFQGKSTAPVSKESRLEGIRRAAEKSQQKSVSSTSKPVVSAKQEVKPKSVNTEKSSYKKAEKAKVDAEIDAEVKSSKKSLAEDTKAALREAFAEVDSAEKAEADMAKSTKTAAAKSTADVRKMVSKYRAAQRKDAQEMGISKPTADDLVALDSEVMDSLGVRPLTTQEFESLSPEQQKAVPVELRPGTTRGAVSEQSAGNVTADSIIKELEDSLGFELDRRNDGLMNMVDTAVKGGGMGKQKSAIVNALSENREKFEHVSKTNKRQAKMTTGKEVGSESLPAIKKSLVDNVGDTESTLDSLVTELPRNLSSLLNKARTAIPEGLDIYVQGSSKKDSKMDGHLRDNGNAGALYNVTDNTIMVPKSSVGRADIGTMVVHEVIHAATVGAIKSDKAVKDTVSSLRKHLMSNRGDESEYVKRVMDEINADGDVGLYELISYGMTDPEVQKYFKQVPSMNGNGTIFTDFVNLISKILNLKGDEVSFLEEVLAAGDKAIEVNRGRNIRDDAVLNSLI